MSWAHFELCTRGTILKGTNGFSFPVISKGTSVTLGSIPHLRPCTLTVHAAGAISSRRRMLPDITESHKVAPMFSVDNYSVGGGLHHQSRLTHLSLGRQSKSIAGTLGKVQGTSSPLFRTNHCNNATHSGLPFSVSLSRYKANEYLQTRGILIIITIYIATFKHVCASMMSFELTHIGISCTSRYSCVTSLHDLLYHNVIRPLHKS